MVLATEELPERWSASVIKVSGQMCSNTFKRRLVALQLHSNNFGLTQLATTVKSFITKELGCEAILKFKKQFLCIATNFLVMSPCLCDFFFMSLYI